MKKELLPTNQKGISLIEVILTGAIFMIVVTTFTSAIISAQEATQRAGARSRALLIANEGLEATRNIRDDDFALLVDGTYGLAVQSNTWEFVPSVDVTDIFSRSVTISTVDANTKLVTSNVTWSGSPASSGSVALNTYLSYWDYSTIIATQADSITIDASGASLSGNNKTLRDIILTNTSPTQNVVITHIQGSWTTPGAEISHIRSGNTALWAKNGPGTPLGDQPSGTLLDVDDFTINADTTVNIDNTFFTLAMSGAQFTFVLTFSDGSQTTFQVF